jgi:voltage-gated potassium channel
MSYENVSDIWDMIYYNIVTASTVGYGDMSPSTKVGKIATSVYIFFIISLFATLLSSIGSIAFTYLSRKNKGIIKINKDVDFVIIGGYEDKIESVVSNLLKNKPSLKICVISDVYDEKPELFLKKGVYWVNGAGTDINKLNMINDGKSENYIILSVNPTNKKNDSFIKLAYENILSISNKPNILAEIVRNNLIGFPKNENIRYIQTSRSAILAKEALTSGVFDFFHQVFNNMNEGNQYNIKIEDDTSWLELCNKSIPQGIVPIGYLCDDEWVFCPEDVNDIDLEVGCTVKYLARDTKKLSENNEKLLIIGSDKYRLDLIIKDYKSDSRFIKSQITVMGKNKVSLANNFVFSSDITDENIYTSNKFDIDSFDNILILGNTIDKKSDNNNYLAYSVVRELNVNAQIVVEIVGSNLRTLLESRYEDRNNQFTGISQTGQLVQELQDEGAISFIEDVSYDTTSVDIHEIILSKDYYWLDVLEKMTEGIYPVGYKIQNEDWLFEPENVKIKLPKNTIVKYMARKEVEL